MENYNEFLKKLKKEFEVLKKNKPKTPADKVKQDFYIKEKIEEIETLERYIKRLDYIEEVKKNENNIRNS